MTNNNFSYALGNPLSALLDKPCQDFRRDDFIKVIEQKQLERITFHYTALDGKLKELRLPVSGRRQAECILGEGERVDGSSLFKGMVDPALSDLYVVPEYKTAFLNPFDHSQVLSLHIGSLQIRALFYRRFWKLEVINHQSSLLTYTFSLIFGSAEFRKES